MTPDHSPDWKELVDGLSDLVARVDSHFRHLYVNRKWQTEIGIPEEQVLGKTPRELQIPTDICDRLDAGFQQVLQQRAVHEFPCPFPGTHGQQHYAVRMLPELGPDGQVNSVLAICRNITAQVAAETALVDTESRFQAFMNNSPGIAWMKDEAGRYVYFSPSAEKLYGLDSADWMGKTDADLWPPEIARNFRQNDLAVLSDGRTRLVIEESQNPDGSESFWSTYKFLVHDAAGNRFVGGTGLDVTDRTLAEFNWQESEIWLRAILEAGAFIVIGMTEDYHLFEWNRAAEQIYGWRRQEVLGKNYLDNFLPESARAGVAEEIRQIFLGRQTVAYPNEVLHRDGSRRTVLWNACCVKDARQRVRGLLAIGQDITDLQRAQSAIRESEGRYRQLIESIHDVVWSIEIDNDPHHGRIKFVSPQAEQLLGYAADEFLHHPEIWAERLHPDDKHSLQDNMQRLITEPHPVSRVYRFRHGVTGEYRWLEDRVAAQRDAAGKLTGLFGVARDISLRIRAQEALQKSEQFTQAVLDSLPAEIAVLDNSGRIIAINEPWRRFGKLNLGAATARMEIGADYLAVCRSAASGGSASAAAALEGIVSVMEGRWNRFEHEYPCHAPDRQRWFLMQVVRPSTDSGGAIVAHFEITERRRAEEALRENEQRLQLTLDASQAATWSWDVVKNIAKWDHRYYEHYELDPLEPASHEKWMERVHPEDRERLQARIQVMLQPYGDDIWNEEFRTIPLTDGTRWMAGLGRVQRDDQGRAIRFSGLNLDITARKQAELAAQQAATELQALMDAFPDLHFWLDADGTIRRHHAGARPHLPAEEFFNCRMQDAFPAEIGQRLMSSITHALANGQIQEFEYTVAESDSTRWYDARIVPLSASDSVLLVIRDVTARRRAEEEGRRLQTQLQHSQKLESLGVLAGGIAHDFNNILTSIMGFTDLALATLTDGDDARLHLDRVMTSARRAAELTQQMLAYSGRGHFVVEGVNLSEIIQEIGPLLAMSISKKARVHYRLQSDLPEVRADTAQLRQIIMNLIINASDSLEDRPGEITVETYVRNCNRDELAQTFLDEQLQSGRYVILEVSDTGVGMDAETSVRIFEPFFTTKSAGRGLGLAAVLGIIRGHHGAIRVISQPGQGAKFQVMLPVSPTSKPTPEITSPAAEPPALQGLVLVVDDEPAVRDLAQAMLERAGFRVLTACDGLAALELFRGRFASISLVLLDMTMPYMSGEETFRELQRIDPAVRVVLTSGYNEQSATTEILESGVAGFLQKPYRYQVMVETLTRALSHEAR